MDWIYTDDKLPSTSGKYYVCAMIKNHQHRKAPFAFTTEFNAESNTFSFDETMKERDLPQRVYAWCELPKAIKPKSSEQHNASP